MPTAREPKIQYGLCNLAYSVMTENAQGEITFATPVPIPGAISISLPPQGERKYLSADNGVYFEAWSNGGYQGDVTVARIPKQFRLDCLGEQQDAAQGSNVIYETTQLITQRFALLGQFENDLSGSRWVFYNCTASRPQFAGQTIDGESGVDPSQSTDAFSLSAKGMRVGDKYMVKAVLEDDGSETYSNWFSAVYVPTVASS